MFKIEEGIPIPPRANRRPGTSKYPFDQMEPGDSFYVPVDADKGDTLEKVRGRMTQAATKAGKRYDVEFAVRTMSDGVRVWRVS